MPLLIALLALICLVWLFSGAGNFKRNAQRTVLWIAFLLGSAVSVTVGYEQHMTFLTALPIVVLIVMWKTRRKAAAAAQAPLPPPVFHAPSLLQRVAVVEEPEHKPRVLTAREPDPFAAGIAAMYPPPPPPSPVYGPADRWEH